MTQADLDAGQIVNTASASNGVVTSPPDTATVDAIAAPRLLVVKSSVTKSLSAPQTVTYTYLVRNVGNVTVTGIALSDDNDNNDLSCPQTTLAPGALMTCTATHTFTQAELDANGSPVADSDKLANTVTATSDQAPTATDDHVIPIVQVAGADAREVGDADEEQNLVGGDLNSHLPRDPRHVLRCAVGLLPGRFGDELL